MYKRNFRHTAFTLIEVLVVIAIIALLLSVIIPTLTRAKEQSHRVVCRNNIRVFVVAIHAYANSNEYRLPYGVADMEEDNTPLLSNEMFKTLSELAGSKKTLVCPWLGWPLENSQVCPQGAYGILIGYNYLGGHVETPWPLAGVAEKEWVSPQLSTEKGYLPIITELNAWTSYLGRTFAPHGKYGPLMWYAKSGEACITSQEVGAEGGNIGLLDGSVSWKDIENMEIYRGSRSHIDIGVYSLR